MRRETVRVVIPEVVDPDEPERREAERSRGANLEALRRLSDPLAQFVEVIGFAGALLEAADVAGRRAEKVIRNAHREAKRNATARLRGGRK